MYTLFELKAPFSNYLLGHCIYLRTLKILGISAYYHDSAATLIVNGELVAAAQEERFTRKKNEAGFPALAIGFCLAQHGISVNELDAIVFYDKPFLKFERILQTVLETAPRGWFMFMQSMPVWLKEKLFLKSTLKKELKKIGGKKIKVPLLFSSHHLSHAASAFYASPFEEAAVLTMDGVGEWATATIAYGKENQLNIIKELNFPHSLGLLYAAFTYFLGFKINEGEYKVMGLAPYAERESEEVRSFDALIRQYLVTVNADGSLQLNLKYFSFTHTLRMLPEKKWETLLNMKRRKEHEPLTSQHAALAMALQKITEEVVLAMAAHAAEITGSKNLCLSGGVALNCVANGKLEKQKIFEHIFVQPASGDAGGALGAALGAFYLHHAQPRTTHPNWMRGGDWGPQYNDGEIVLAIEQAGLPSERLPQRELIKKCAAWLAEGKVMGWFNGRMEFGPRALGYRSILADAAQPDMQKKLNLKIKKRESFRPFAPIMLEEELDHYFEGVSPNAYMLFVHPLKPEWCIPRPNGFYQWPLADMLGHAGSVLPAITHIDYSARFQTVGADSEAAIRLLLLEFKKLTGRGVLVNTSFNIKDEPIVCTPADAIRCFLQTEMDILVLENYVLTK
jgi:carbamoyltransferase